jgi:UDP-N-acetylglucosamine 3-dehydrogenase
MKVGIVGCGAIAARAHVPAFARAGANIVAVADTDLRRAQDFAKKFHIPAAYSDYRQLLDEDLELVSVCSPPETHARIAVDAANMGKQILVEKPMATNLDDAERIARSCETNQVKLCVMHQYRFIPSVQEAKRRLSVGRLGQVLSIQMVAHPQFPLRWSDSAWLYTKWSLLDDVGVHLLDVLSYLTQGRPRHVSAVARDTGGKMGFYDNIQVMIELVDSSVAFLDLSWVVGTTELSSQIFGSAGKLDLDMRQNYLGESHGYITPFDELSSTIRKSWKTMASALTKKYFRGTLIYHDVVIRSFIDSITRGKDSPVGPEEGKRIVEFLEVIKQSTR